MTLFCPKCDCAMECKVNPSGVVLTSYPPQWQDVYFCRYCKVKKSVWRREMDYSKGDTELDLKTYQAV